MQFQQKLQEQPETIEELINEVNYMRGIAQQCKQLRKQIEEMSKICEKRKGEVEEQREKEGLRERIRAMRERIRMEEDTTIKLREEGQKLTDQLQILSNIPQQPPISPTDLLLPTDPSTILQTKSSLQKSCLQCSMLHPQTLFETLQYLQTGIEQLKHDIEYTKQQLTLTKMNIRKHRYEHAIVSRRNGRLREEVGRLEEMLRGQEVEMGEQEEGVWVVREETCEIRRVNFQIRRQIERTEGVLSMLKKQREMMQFELKKIHIHNTNIQKVILKRRHQDSDYSQASDVTVVKSGTKVNHFRR